MQILGISTGNMLGLGLVAGAFIVFALVVSMVIPRFRPDFPGKSGVRPFLVLTLVFFVGTLAAVEGFAKEEEEGPEHGTPAGEVTTKESAPATTSAGGVTHTVVVKASEFELEPSQTDFGPGSYEFELRNEGKDGHDLVISGPGNDNTATPVIGPGEKADLKVALQSGTYKLYCNVPGHEAAGMHVEITVS